MKKGLFRGKSLLNGDFVEGFLFKTKEHTYIAFPEQYDDDLFLSPKNIFIEVDPETVGQYICSDKNGNKIFEDDFVKIVVKRDMGYTTEMAEIKGIVEYNELGILSLISYFTNDIAIYSDIFCELTLSNNIEDYWFEIIGNIYDNPEILNDINLNKIIK